MNLLLTLSAIAINGAGAGFCAFGAMDAFYERRTGPGITGVLLVAINIAFVALNILTVLCHVPAR